MAILRNKTKKVSNTPVTDAGFSDIKFKGTFREYQQKVINNSEKHLANGKIHIVAAPGSGKTILGLELIRMLGQPALILSPTIAIREQWKERWADMFVPDGSNVNDTFSCSLLKPKLLTSITYQGLYSSYMKVASAPKPVEDDEEIPDENYSGINIIELMKENKISVLCLDEAHHLRAEWQRALYEFVGQVEHGVKIIALTATPPYDSKKVEWDKYTAMCGPIDEEIFVPELIRAKTLCPHQDYICYNFPSQNEIDLIENYNNKVTEAMKTIFEEKKFLEIIKNSDFYKDPLEFEDELAERPNVVKAVLSFLDESKEKPTKEYKLLRKTLERDDKPIAWDLEIAGGLFQSMIKDDQLFNTKDREYVKNFLSRRGLVEKNEVALLTNTEIEKLLFTSRGKLASIEKIVDTEWKDLGDKTRLLILTDYIRANSQVLGTDMEITELGVIPIFEMIRRKKLGIKLAAISGKVIFVPSETIPEITEIAQTEKARVKFLPIPNTEHSEIRFEGSSNAVKISVITKSFNRGIINGIVGTKSLLGEGWDSPVINTLILASCVGSFMLSNQMRGRAIRVDKNNPDKVSNIWHLTAILPEHLMPEVSKELPPSSDYEMLERRFSGFLGLNYEKEIIESGLTRASTLKPPYTEKSVAAANEKSFEHASNREEVAKHWYNALAKSSNEVLLQNEIQKPKRGFIPAILLPPPFHWTVRKITNAVMKAFKDLNLINKKAKPLVENDYKNKTVNLGISRCSQYEKSIFHQAIGEVFGPIDMPKYFLVKTKNEKPDPRCAFAVPEIFSKNKANAEVFEHRMFRRVKHLKLYSSRSADGKKLLINVKRKAYVNKNAASLTAKMKLKPSK